MLRKLRSDLKKADGDKRSLKGGNDNAQRTIYSLQGREPVRSSSTSPTAASDVLPRLEGANGRRVKAQDDLQNASRLWGSKLNLFVARPIAAERDREN